MLARSVMDFLAIIISVLSNVRNSLTVRQSNYFWHSEDLRTSLECVCEQVSVGLCLCAHTYMWVQIADAYIHTQSVSEIQPSISRSWYCLVFANLSQRSTFYVIFF